MSDEQANAPQSETVSWFADNQANWDSRAHAHMFGNYGGKDELIADKTAISSVLAVDVDRFGDLAGKSVCHLQCHVGTDTIGFVRRGASRVVGVDLSAESLNYARAFAAQADAEVEFIQSNVYDARPSTANSTSSTPPPVCCAGCRRCVGGRRSSQSCLLPAARFSFATTTPCS
mgnify:CR=1 FL=1